MTGMRGKEIRSVPYDGVAGAAEAERFDTVGPMPGVVVDFDASTKVPTATVAVQYKPRHNGEPVDMPNLLKVPVMFPRAAGFTITFPVKAGDGVMLIPQMRDLDNWFIDGGAQPAATERAFDWSDMIAVVGLNSDPDGYVAPDKYDGSRVYFGTDDFDKGNVRIADDGAISTDSRSTVSTTADGEISTTSQDAISSSSQEDTTISAQGDATLTAQKRALVHGEETVEISGSGESLMAIFSETLNWLSQEPQLIYKPQYADLRVRLEKMRNP